MRFVHYSLIVLLLAGQGPARAEETATRPAIRSEVLIEQTTEDPALAENLVFAAGEVSGIDREQQRLSVVLYGDVDASGNEKTITLGIDGTTDLTDGEREKSFQDLIVGAEVDVEYNPENQKATYIFIY